MADDPDNKKRGLSEMVKAESMIQAVLSIPIGCVLGWLAGAWLDRHFNQGWMTITGILLGAIGGFIQIFRTASGYLKDDR